MDGSKTSKQVIRRKEGVWWKWWGIREVQSEKVFHITTKKERETVTQRYSAKKVFLEISQIHRKTPVPESLFK